MTIWKTNPVAAAAALSALLAFCATLPVFGMDQHELAVTMGVGNAILGILTAAWTRRTALGLVVGFIQALQAFFIGYRLDFLDADQSAALITLVTFAGAAFHWWATGPATTVTLNPSSENGTTPALPAG